MGGCDIVMNMHQSGELEKVLESAGVLVPFEEAEGKASTEGGEDVVGQGTVERRVERNMMLRRSDKNVELKEHI